MVVITDSAGWPQLAAASELSIVRTAEPAVPTADTKSLTAKARWYNPSAPIKRLCTGEPRSGRRPPANEKLPADAERRNAGERKALRQADKG